MFGNKKLDKKQSGKTQSQSCSDGMLEVARTCIENYEKNKYMNTEKVWNVLTSEWNMLFSELDVTEKEVVKKYWIRAIYIVLLVAAEKGNYDFYACIDEFEESEDLKACLKEYIELELGKQYFRHKENQKDIIEIIGQKKIDLGNKDVWNILLGKESKSHSHHDSFCKSLRRCQSIDENPNESKYAGMLHSTISPEISKRGDVFNGMGYKYASEVQSFENNQFQDLIAEYDFKCILVYNNNNRFIITKIYFSNMLRAFLEVTNRSGQEEFLSHLIFPVVGGKGLKSYVCHEGNFTKATLNEINKLTKDIEEKKLPTLNKNSETDKDILLFFGTNINHMLTCATNDSWRTVGMLVMQHICQKYSEIAANMFDKKTIGFLHDFKCPVDYSEIEKYCIFPASTTVKLSEIFGSEGCPPIRGRIPVFGGRSK